MINGNGFVAESERFREMDDGATVLDFLRERIEVTGATHFLATGLPLPNRPIAPLILRIDWGEGFALEADDPVLQASLSARRVFFWPDRRPSAKPVRDSALLTAVGPAGDALLLVVPINGFLPYQATVVAGGTRLAAEPSTLLGIDHFCNEAFRRLIALDLVRTDRPGDLSARERRVVELSAAGKTASEIAGVLSISQRTVHAHLQNAGEKLQARNKTHTVIEALRYGQIRV
jgi:DNA-binding CsgD family transcriptional regulator